MIQFIAISGGLDGGSEPPAFQRAQQERMAKEYAEENADSSYDTVALQRQNNSNYLNVPDIISFLFFIFLYYYFLQSYD